MLVKLVYSLKLCPLFTESSFLSNSQFWLHSLAVAIFSQSLSRKIKAPLEEQDITYLAGLMHDIGIMGFGYLVPLEYDDFLTNIQGKDGALGTLEKNTFGIDHAELGALYIEKWWDVDENITHAVRYHHEPFNDQAHNSTSVQLVNIANSICNNQGITNGIDCLPDKFNEEEALTNLGLSQDEVENIMEDVETALDQAKELVGHSFSG